jgi:hypothetical protein
MSSNDAHKKFPEGSANRDYDVFEEYPDGSTVWRASVFGMENVELKLRELTKETGNKLFALYLQDPSLVVIHPLRYIRNQELRRVS